MLARRLSLGGVVEWLMAPVLKTGRPKGLVGSNPTPSAKAISDLRFSIGDSAEEEMCRKCSANRA
jgi:hypothetical protein